MKDAILVTGAGSGIGAAIAKRLSTDTTVILTGRNEERLLALRAQLKSSLAFRCDFRNASDIEHLANYVKEQTAKQSLRLVGLVNNAGAYVRKSFAELSDDEWLDQMRVNLLSPVHLTRELFPLLKAGAPSSILNISSTLGLRSVAQTSAYSASKAAMIRWTETLALEWAPHKIRVNCICPGIVDTPIHASYGRSDDDPQRALMHAAQPLKRMGEPAEIAEAAAFLMSEKSAWTTGAVLTVDGGIHL